MVGIHYYILEKPTVTLNCPNTTTLNEGDDFSCICRGEDGSPPANVTWYKDDKKFGEIRKKEQSLTLRNVDDTDSGTYKCLAESYPHEDYQDRRTLGIIVNCICEFKNSTWYRISEAKGLQIFISISWHPG